jgi:hypothetical protein
MKLLKLFETEQQWEDTKFWGLSNPETDEGIPTSLPSSNDDIAGRVDVQHKPNDLRIGSITRARAKLLEQQVNSLLTEYNLFTNENFILPKFACLHDQICGRSIHDTWRRGVTRR